MAKQIGPPCMRGLKAFEKKGCPMKTWDGKTGCPAWVEMLVTGDDPKVPKDKVGNCVDIWSVNLQLKSLALLEGNQQATESFRNNMTVNGSPRPDPAVMALLQAVREQNRELGYRASHAKLIS